MGMASGAAGNISDEATRRYSFWKKMFGSFNPQAPQIQTPSAAPYYGQAAENTSDYLSNVLSRINQGPVGAGGMDPGGNKNAFADAFQVLGQRKQLGKELPNFSRNAGFMLDKETGGFGRFNKIGDTEQDRATREQYENLADLRASDDINAMYDEYEAGAPSPGDLLAQTLGGVGGGILGEVLAKKRRT